MAAVAPALLSSIPARNVGLSSRVVVGLPVGTLLGRSDGAVEKVKVGADEGELLGTSVACKVGVVEGSKDGAVVGLRVVGDVDGMEDGRSTGGDKPPRTTTASTEENKEFVRSLVLN